MTWSLSHSNPRRVATANDVLSVEDVRPCFHWQLASSAISSGKRNLTISPIPSLISSLFFFYSRDYISLSDALPQFIPYLIQMSTRAPPYIELIVVDSNYSKATS